MEDAFVDRGECSDKQKEHKEAIERVHNKVDAIEKTTSSIETYAKIISEGVEKIEKVMWGDQNADGLVTKVSNLNQKVSGVYWFSGIVVTALVVSLISSLVALGFRRG